MSVFEQQSALAVENFEVVYENFIGVHQMSREIHHVIAEAGTGSRYSVVVTPLGHGGRHEGGGAGGAGEARACGGGEWPRAGAVESAAGATWQRAIRRG